MKQLKKNMLGPLKAIYRRIMFKLLYPLYYKFHKSKPIKDNKIVFIETFSSVLTNNYKLLYKKLIERNKYEISISFVLRGKPGRFWNAFKMIKNISDAKYVFINDGLPIINSLKLRNETILTQTFHACGAFKKFGYSTADAEFGSSRKVMEKYPLYKNQDYVTVSSENVIWAYADAMGLENNKDIIKPVGVSRTDVFFNEQYRDAAFENLYVQVPKAKKKRVILYAPTYRGSVYVPKIDNKIDIKSFYDNFKEDYILIFKNHPLIKEDVNIDKEYKEFAFDVSKTMDIQDLLVVSDICITDYSSLIFEYSLFERPIIFYAFDLEDYYDARGFYYSYEELTPGPICKTNQEIIDYIINVDEKFDKNDIIKFKNKFMGACDGKATERILNMIFKENQTGGSES